MGTIPTSPRSAVLAWCQAHYPIFLDNASEIGLTTDQANAFKTATLNYGGSSAAAEAARIAAETATETAREQYTVMRRLMSQAITAIRIYADQTNDPSVFSIAQIPPPQPPSELPPPGTPFDLTVELLASTGALQLRWKCDNPRGAQGTSYIVRRKLPTESTFMFVGVSGEKRFVDNDFFAGPDNVQYTVQGQRADRAGLVSAVFQISFGRTGPGVNRLSILSTGTRNVSAAA